MDIIYKISIWKLVSGILLSWNSNMRYTRTSWPCSLLLDHESFLSKCHIFYTMVWTDERTKKSQLFCQKCEWRKPIIHGRFNFKNTVQKPTFIRIFASTFMNTRSSSQRPSICRAPLPSKTSTIWRWISISSYVNFIDKWRDQVSA